MASTTAPPTSTTGTTVPTGTTGTSEQEETRVVETFETPKPIAADIDVVCGHVHVRAGDRADTVVDVRPTDESEADDVRAADETAIELVDGRLSVKTRRYKLRSIIGRPPSVDVVVDLPSGSRVDVSALAEVRCEGRLGDVVADTGLGSIRIEETGRLRAKTAAGDVVVGRSLGPAHVTTASGRIRIGSVDGTAEVWSSNGEITIGAVAGDVRIKTANGDIAVERAGASVEARTAFGSVRVGEVTRGSVDLQTSFGQVEVGVREGTAAWLDVRSKQGTVRSQLETTDDPGPTTPTVEVHARTGFGDILIHRSHPADTT